jgi:hypothetical protein
MPTALGRLPSTRATVTPLTRHGQTSSSSRPSVIVALRLMSRSLVFSVGFVLLVLLVALAGPVAIVLTGSIVLRAVAGAGLIIIVGTVGRSIAVRWGSSVTAISIARV